MEKLFEVFNKDGYNKVFSQNNSLNLVTVKNNVVFHKQVEMKGGKIFMRMKRRDLLSCS